MKKWILVCMILAALLALCSCRKKTGLRNNLKTVDMSQFSKTISMPNNDSRVEDEGTAAQTANSGNNADSTVDAQKDNSAQDDGKSTGSVGTDKTQAPTETAKPGSGNSPSIGDVDLPTGSANGDKTDPDAVQEAESAVRESIGSMENEKYLIYLPSIIETIDSIDRTMNGATVHFRATSQDRFDSYVSQLRSKGFVQDISLSGMSFSAHTKDGMYVKFIVTATESWLAIYDDASHIGG